MASQHTTVGSRSLVSDSLFLGLFKTEQFYQLYSKSRIDGKGGQRRRSKSAECKWHWAVENKVVPVNVFSPAHSGKPFCQSVVHRVVDKRSAKGLRNVEVRAEPLENEGDKVDYTWYQALMRGGEQIAEMMKEMVELLEDIAGFDKEEEEAALRMAVAGVVGQKLDKLEGNFLTALDWTIEQTGKENDDKKKRVLEIIKETVMAQLANKFPSQVSIRKALRFALRSHRMEEQVQVVGALCTTPTKDARQEILRRCAGGGGTFKTEKGDDIQLPGVNLNEIANQADDIISTMEAQPLVPDRRLLAKLVLVREEARSLMGGGILDERNDNKGFKNLPEPEVNFLSKLVALKPGPPVRERLAKVMRGKDEGKEKATKDTESQPPRPKQRLVNINGDAKAKGAKEKEVDLRPVRPGIFLETLTKLMAGMYASKTAVGVTVQQLEWIHRVTLDILQEMAFS